MKFKQKIALTAEQSIEYAIRLADALSVLHGKKITHRDIKCGNIMVLFYIQMAEMITILILHKLDQDMKPKLGDFGTSKVLQTILGASTVIGSFFYMAPEIIDGHNGDPLPSDVYRYYNY